MYLVYVDESGTRDPETVCLRPDGTSVDKDWLYVLVGVALLDLRWFKFEHVINARKLQLLNRLRASTGVQIDLADTEVKSTWVRIPRVRACHRFLSRLTEDELKALVDLYFAQLEYHRMQVFAVVVDKRHLHSYFDEEKLHRKAYELLIERVEWFMRLRHRAHRALMVLDNTSRQMNRSLAVKHSYFQRKGTSSGARIGHIVELPMFVQSDLSNGVQLADLCAYNIYRAFKCGDLMYQFFQRVEPWLYSRPDGPAEKVEGLKVFPDESPLVALAAEAGRRRAQGIEGSG